MSAYKDAKLGTWYVKFRHKNWKNEFKWVTKRGFPTKREALQWEQEYLLQCAGDLGMNFEAFAKRYEDDQRPRMKESTWCTKEHIIQTKIIPHFKTKRVCDITATDVVQWQNELQEAMTLFISLGSEFKTEFFHLLYIQSKFDCEDYPLCLQQFNILYEEAEKQHRINEFKKLLNSPVSCSTKKRLTIEDIDLMSGHEFEIFLKDLFTNMGYSCVLTQKSNDQGVDLLAKKGPQVIGIQAKCYSSTVGNSAIQEVAAGKNYYQATDSMVVTNSYFTKSAIALAESNQVKLWDREILKEKMLNTDWN